ncbi:unnamed protein product [Eruca vesicaria subsp. sativa]|uniref:F-box domain-containing protein n=1 Tax=Eruca vesicaria subsp. sativa TaxID=29727 RepID=A0ABC8KP58_ERUVS|nr:unnamed protein product [Eruca vesicaria subsp. sativa]
MLDSSAEGPPQHKETKTSLPLSFPLSLLPDEVALSCLARVPRSDYIALSLVSKKYRSLVCLPALYKKRSILGFTEDCFYICLSSGGYESSPVWLIFHREKRFMIPIPTLLPQLPRGSSVVVLDGKIYVIGGLSGTKHSSSDVFLLDCRSHTWHCVPSMSVPRSFSAAGVVDGKIYVIGGCRTIDLSLCYGEVFDPKTQTWETLVPITDHNTKKLFDYNHVYDESLVIEDKVYALHRARGVYYSPHEAKWELTENDVWRLRFQNHCCVMEKLLYGCDDYGDVFWCE